MSNRFAAELIRVSSVDVLSGSANPTAGAGVAAPTGSVYMRQNGQVWTKTGTADTSWSLSSFVVDGRAYGALGDGNTDNATAIQAALNDVAATVGGAGQYGGFVDLPKGLFMLGSQITIPNGVGLRGAGPSATVLKAKSTFNGTSLITNLSQDGTQEYAFLESLQVDGNKGSGAVCSTAVVDFVSLFVNSYVRDVIINNGSNVGLRIAARNASGPLLVENCWILRNDGHNLLVEEEAGNTAAMKGICFVNLTCEHMATGKSSIYLKGLGRASQWNFFNTHIEMTNGGAGTCGVTIDGVSHVTFTGLQLQCGSIAGVTGVKITNVAQNLGLQLRGITNINLINPVIDDLKNDCQFGAVNVPTYATPDVGIMQALQGEQALMYGASVNINCALGNYCTLVVSNNTAFTINAPTNAPTGMELTLEIVNTSGGAMGAITWNAAFAFMTAWTNPASNKRRTIRFRKRSGGNWIQIGLASTDM